VNASRRRTLCEVGIVAGVVLIPLGLASAFVSLYVIGPPASPAAQTADALSCLLGALALVLGFLWYPLEPEVRPVAPSHDPPGEDS
jgi:hypothetical protein